MLSPTVFQLADSARVSTAVHPLAGTAAEWMWALPLLPLLGFVINGALSVMGAAHIGPSDPTARTGMGTRRAQHGDAARRQAHAARHRFAGVVSIIGPLVLIAAFGLACAIWAAMVGGIAHDAVHPAVLPLDAGRRPADRRGVPARSALDDARAGDHGRRCADPHFQRRLHARRSRVPPLLRVPEPLRRSSCWCWCWAPTCR